MTHFDGFIVQHLNGSNWEPASTFLFLRRLAQIKLYKLSRQYPGETFRIEKQSAASVLYLGRNTMKELPLFDHIDPTKNYHKGNPQSDQAWASMKPRDLTELRLLIFKEIGSRNGGLTCDEIEQCLNLSHQTASARITELKQKGYIVQSGIRPTRTGRSAAVYVADKDRRAS